MNVKEIKSSVIKKRLYAKQVCYRWHNKNKTGGNFGINICGVNDKDYEISGYYDIEGTVRGLRFGFIYTAGIPMSVQTIEEMFEFIEKSIENRR